jgi:3-deoxy-D-manno-octulosonic-acid transferase
LLKNKASIQVQNADELFENIIQLLDNPQQLKALGANAKTYFDAQQGAVKKLVKLIKTVI